LSQKILSKLQSRNVTIATHRTSLRLEGDTWNALEEICSRERMSIHDVCMMIENQRFDSSRTAAVRAYILTYFRAAATEQGHSQARHGTLMTSKQENFRPESKRENTEIRVAS